MPHVSRHQLLELKKTATVKVGQRYQHYKTGGIYQVDNLVILEATDQLAVLYHDVEFMGLSWVRSHNDFTAQIEPGVPRFKLLA